MSWHGPGFVIAMIAISTMGWVLTTWIRARHGYPVEGEWGGQTGRDELPAERKVALLTSETERMQGQIGRLEERIAVLERIATDRSHDLADQIERLR